MKVFIHGFYGAGNAGDDAILHAIVDRLKQINANITVAVSIRSKNIKAYFGEESIEYVLGTDIAGVSKIIKESSLVIVGGGGLFQDYNSFEPENLFFRQKGAINYYSYPIIIAKMLNIKVMLYAVGIGPLKSSSSQTAMKWIADNVDEITVRDQQSYQLLQDLGVAHHTLSADPVITLDSIPATLPSCLAKPSGFKVGLNLRNWSYSTEKLKEMEHRLIPLLNKLAIDQSIHYYIFPFNNLPSEMEKAKQLAKQGANVAITYVASEAKAAAVVNELKEFGVKAIAIKSDQGDLASAQPLIDTVISEFGKLDILINNAGIAIQGQLTDDPTLDAEKFNSQWHVNVLGSIAVTRAAAAKLTDGGRIIFIGSLLGSYVPFAGAADYAGSKTALVGYARGVARDLGGRNITVNVIQPGVMPTDMAAAVLGENGAPDALLDLHPIRRIATLEEVSETVCFIAGPHAGYITGETINVAGGLGI